MSRVLLFLAVATLASCSKGAEADLPSISQARSLAAEWALVNEEAARNHLSAAYAETMRESIHEQLQTTAGSLTQPHASYAAEIAALLREPAEAPPAALRAHASKLKQVEDRLESD